MRKTLLAATAALAISSPAIARDGSPYVGFEAGPMMSDEGFFDADLSNGATNAEFNNAVNLDYKIGVDADLIGGYDFGMFRLEAELAYKRLGVREVRLSGPLVGAIDPLITTDPNDLDIDGSARVTSIMGNALLDFGGNDGFGAYVGGGLGAARTKLLGDRDSGLAWQLIAGVRAAVTPNIDVGVKYRYFVSNKLRLSDEFVSSTGTPFSIDTEGRLKTHSLLLSLIYNFAAAEPPPPPPAPPPPPPPAAPATQTCPDGSVILATEVCPAPPPPPPPPPAPERG